MLVQLSLPAGGNDNAAGREGSSGGGGESGPPTRAGWRKGGGGRGNTMSLWRYKIIETSDMVPHSLEREMCMV